MSRFLWLNSQYFDDAGDPLIEGKLYFFNAGTSTPKNTYADVAETISNTNPVILSAAGRLPNVFFTGTARIILTDKDDVQIEQFDNISVDTSGSGGGQWGDYVSTTTYGINDIVEGGDGEFYISIVAGNKGNDPVSNPDKWVKISLITAWSEDVTYSEDDLVLATNKILYVSQQDSNLNNDPTTDDGTWWKPIASLASDTNPTLSAPLETNQHQVRWSKGADVASAAALPILADGNYYDVTGMETITSINTSGSVGTVIKLHFDAALTLTHNATDLVLPGGANITTAAGDEAEFVEYASGDWRCTKYTKADGTAVISSDPGLIHLETINASGASTVDFTTNIDGTYDKYLVEGVGITHSIDASELRCRVFLNAAWQTSGYRYHVRKFESNSSVGSTQSQSAQFIQLLTAVSNVAAEAANISLLLLNPASTTVHPQIQADSQHINSDSNTQRTVSGGHNENDATAAVTGLRFLASSGTITGTFRLYGISNG